MTTPDKAAPDAEVYAVAAGSHTIEFEGINTAGGDDTCFIDLVAIVPQGGPVSYYDDANASDFQGVSASTPWSANPPTSPSHYYDGTYSTGIGTGLTLPTFMATGAATLPANAFATGSGVLNMLRQLGFAVGVAVLIAVLGTPHGAHDTLDAFRRGWAATGTTALLSAATFGELGCPRGC